MQIKYKPTGLTWEIEDLSLFEHLIKTGDYEVMELTSDQKKELEKFEKPEEVRKSDKFKGK